MNRPTTLLQQVLINYGLLLRLAIERDARVIERRFRTEGKGFLTITLPTLEDALLQGLSRGRLTPLMFNGFKPFKRGGSYPAFLSGFFSRIFGTDGSLLEHPCIESIDAIRQICRLDKKVEDDCSKAKVNKAFERYVQNEKDISKYSRRSFDSFPNWGAVSGYLWSDLELSASDIYCSPGVFGSGATAERSSLHGRLRIRQWPCRGEREFPSSYHTSHREDDREGFEALSFLGGGDELPIRVVTVPKTLKTPRIIGVEPSYAMLRQQSVWKWLQQYLEGPKFPFNSIRFKDQSMNRKLACIGSADSSLATIDLSDASDRVSNRLVASTFKSCPSFLRMIFAARTRQAILPSGELRNLRKFASMGSALCFPIESMVFFTIVMTSLLNQSGKRPSRSVLQHLAKDVAIYGDDIIVPTQMAAGVMEDLESFGLLVNQSKSYHTGSFRESCGGDYYKGELVSPVYVRCWYDNSGERLSASVIAAYISLSNQFYLKGLWHVSQYIRDNLSRDGVKVGRSTKSLGGLTYHSFIYTDARGWCRKTHQYLVRSLQQTSSRNNDPITDYRAAMFYSFQAGPETFEKEAVFHVDDFDATSFRRARLRDVLLLSQVREPARTSDPGEGSDVQAGISEPVRTFGSNTLCGSPWDESGAERHQSRDDATGYLLGIDFDASLDQFPLGCNRFRLESGNVPRILSGVSYDGTSVRSYSLKLKSRLTPTQVGLSW